MAFTYESTLNPLCIYTDTVLWYNSKLIIQLKKLKEIILLTIPYGGFYFVPLPKWTPVIRVGSAKKSYEGTRNGSLFNF